MVTPNSLERDISPPPTRKPSRPKPVYHENISSEVQATQTSGPSLAAIEAGEAEVRDHLAYFSHHLQQASRGTPIYLPRITIEDFQSLYKRNQRASGRHFVVHQHDHPISGVHYDLRLQFSETSTISFAVPYGLPGNPNSIRPNRMAVETRVHNLWNNLIESASHATGSLLIWDTGEYEVLPYRESVKARTTDDELSSPDTNTEEVVQTDSEKLFAAFQARHIRLRLNGTRLPKGYTISLRLPSANDRKAQPSKPRRKWRKPDPSKARKPSPVSTDSEDESGRATTLQTSKSETLPQEDSHIDPNSEAQDAALASDAENEDAAIRSNNAYTGATNTIGSVHQRYWFINLDRMNTGFRKARGGPDDGRWVGDGDFLVLGREVERSVVSGRTANEIMADEGVGEFRGRKMWRPITE